jgi:ribose transport system permease protein
MSPAPNKAVIWCLNNASVALFAFVFLVFGVLTPRFLEPQNLANILVQSSSTAIVAIGMTFVLLTAGVDLSVGAIMFLSAAIAGKLALAQSPAWLAGSPLWVGLIVIVLMGVLFGAINAFFITRLRIMAFIVTLATLYLGRGLALSITKTRAMNMPESFLWLGTARVAGVPVPILILAIVLAAAHFILTRTPFGRQIYAVGASVELARKAGLNTQRILASVYLISGLCAALGGIVALSQLGAVSPTFGNQKEFAAIAAAVLGGTSLFGGRGKVFPGTLLGAVLIQTVENGLVILNADPYVYPLVTSSIIFAAVLVDSVRTTLLAKLGRRKIRLEPSYG